MLSEINADMEIRLPYSNYRNRKNCGFQELGVRGGVECMRNRRVLGALELLCLWLWWLHDCICENSQNHSPKSVRFACVVVVQLLSCI